MREATPRDLNGAQIPKRIKTVPLKTRILRSSNQTSIELGLPIADQIVGMTLGNLRLGNLFSM